MLKNYLMISSVAALLLVGCGGSTDTASDSIAMDSTDITVERGPVHGALVLDTDGEQATFIGKGIYRFDSVPSYPITADGGYVDIDRSGVIDEDESMLGFSMQADSGSVITMATTVASNTQTRSLLNRNFGLSDAIIHSHTPGSSSAIAAISDAVYKYCVDHNTTPSELTEDDFTALQETIDALIAEYADSNKSVAFFEEKMFGRLGGHHKIGPKRHGKVHGDLNSSKHHTHINLDDINISELTDVQSEQILYMAEEEKLAHDIYVNMYETWGTRIFRNIAKAESKHMRLINLLIERYELILPETYSQVGVFNDSELQTAYDGFLEKGALSETDALEVGIAIEESDIADLNESIEAGVPEDLELIYTRLLNGSQRHLNAFETVLASMIEDETEITEGTEE